jgi:hypothetical protein
MFTVWSVTCNGSFIGTHDPSREMPTVQNDLAQLQERLKKAIRLSPVCPN